MALNTVGRNTCVCSGVAFFFMGHRENIITAPSDIQIKAHNEIVHVALCIFRRTYCAFLRPPWILCLSR